MKNPGGILASFRASSLSSMDSLECYQLAIYSREIRQELFARQSVSVVSNISIAGIEQQDRAS